MTGIKTFIVGWQSSWLSSLTFVIAYADPIAVPWVLFGAAFGGAFGGMLGATRRGMRDPVDLATYSLSLALIGFSLAMTCIGFYPEKDLIGYFVIPISAANGMLGMGPFEAAGKKFLEFIEGVDFIDTVVDILGKWKSKDNKNSKTDETTGEP